MSDLLCDVSDKELVEGLEKLVSRERESLNWIVLHLAEIDKRKLYAELGYSSLYAYATSALGYSESAACRRIKAARAILAVPEAYEHMEAGRLSVHMLDAVSEAICGKFGTEIVPLICGKSKDEALRIANSFSPIAPLKAKDVIVPVSVKKKVEVTELFGNPHQNSNYLRSEVDSNPVVESSEQYRIAFTARPEFKTKLDRVRELVGQKGFGNLQDVLETVLDEFIDRHAPEKREERRQVREEKKGRAPAQRAKGIKPANRRFVTSGLRDKILRRDNQCCSFVSPDGIRCGSRMGLQIDHIQPWARGGKSREENLRVLCKAHNLMFARKEFGELKIRT